MKSAACVWIALTAVYPSGAETLASVDGEPITSADIAYTFGGEPTGKKLDDAVNKIVERKLLVRVALAKGLAVSNEDVTRAARLSIRAFGPNDVCTPQQFRRNLQEELLISKYIDFYVFPRIKTDEDSLKTYFRNNIGLFLKKPPAGSEEIAKVFPLYRNEARYRYVKAEITRFLAEEGARAAKTAVVRRYNK